ncbi:MAG: DUF3143 domain-containing protein [Synechococcus sp. MED-G71]|jgi:hypothetical protein|nr:MAG: DUF3143 domain-containing protein [Synechococcus sp. MED-G71]|tara:strand:- start:1236 stop:1496 length:261 start_codon:yes stop_codon:yes gene_type:complete
MLPSSDTPLYSHPLPALEQWLQTSGFIQSPADPCLWTLVRSQWTAELILQSDGLVISWTAEGRSTQRGFSYGLTRADLESAILAGP